MQDNNLGQDNINNENPLEINTNKILEDNELNNVNLPLFEEQDDLLKNNQILNEDNKDENYATDSDIDDPKYIPSGNVLDNNPIDNPIINPMDNPIINPMDNQIDNQIEIPPPNIDNQNKSEILLKSKVLSLQNDANLANQTMKELENQNNLLRTEILKNKEKIQSKEELNHEFQNLFSVFKQRFEQFEEKK